MQGSSLMSDMTAAVSVGTQARAEAVRIAEHQAALTAMRLLGQPLEAPDPVPVIDHKMDQLDVTFSRDWQEFKLQAARIFVDSRAMLEDARVVSVRVSESVAGHPV
jgi:hypothetical protein